MNRIDNAFRHIHRRDFLPPEVQSLAAIDAPISIGYGQTNSQPTTVRMMLEWLGVRPGDKVLDIGSGSGWTSALLSKIVGNYGVVYAVEKIPELLVFGKRNCRRAGVRNVIFNHAGEEFGLPEQGPYDRILVSAAANEVPSSLIAQLRKGGTMVIPVKHNIHIIKKDRLGNISESIHHGFTFVPLKRETMTAR